MGLQELISLLEKYGIKGGILSIIAIFGFIIMKTSWFSTFFAKITDKVVEFVIKNKTSKNPKSKIITESDITNHDIFNYIDFWMYSKVPTFEFSTEYRTIVFRKYLTIFLKKYKDDIGKYVNSKNYKTMDNSQLWKSFLSLTNDIIYDYEKEMENSGIPKIIIDKMKIKNNDNILLTIDLIEGICNSQFYESEDNLLKMYSILNIMMSILESVISNSEPVCNSINGGLRGYKISGANGEVKEP